MATVFGPIWVTSRMDEPRGRHGRVWAFVLGWSRLGALLVGSAVLCLGLVGCGQTPSAPAGVGPSRAVGQPKVHPASPSAVALDAAGDLYVADFTADVVFEIASNGDTRIVAGQVNDLLDIGMPGLSGSGGPATNARIAGPDGLAVGRDGTLYISEHANNRIRKVDPSGVMRAVAGSGPAVLNGGTFGGDGGSAQAAGLDVPTAIALDKNGNLYVTDRLNNRVRRIDPAGVITTVAGTGKPGFSGDGGPATSAQLDGPDGIAVDGRGNLYVCDYGNRRVRKIHTDGVITTIAGTGARTTSGDGGPATRAGLTDPSGLALDNTGNLYIADFTDNRIRRIDPKGTITTIAGAKSPRSGGLSGDGGPATDAALHNPRGITTDPSGNIYFADEGNRRVRKIDTYGTITTILAPVA